MGKVILALFYALLVSCHGYTRVAAGPYKTVVTPIYVDPELPPETVYAIRAWNLAMNGAYYLDARAWGPAPEPPAVVLYAAHKGNPMLRRGGELAVGVTFPWDGTYPSALIYIDIDYARAHPTQLVPIIAHELGHAFGAEHIPGTLMSPTIIDTACIDLPTITAVAKRLHLNPAWLNHC